MFKYYISQYFFYFFKIISGRVCVRVGGLLLDQIRLLTQTSWFSCLQEHGCNSFSQLLYVKYPPALLGTCLATFARRSVLQQFLCFVVKNRIPMIKELLLNCHIRGKKIHTGLKCTS